MGLNPRIYVRSIQKVVFQDNPLFAVIFKLKKMMFLLSELSINSKDISKKINEKQIRFETTKTLINSEFKVNENKYLNLLR